MAVLEPVVPPVYRVCLHFSFVMSPAYTEVSDNMVSRTNKVYKKN
jgi:hypothetical protein